MYLHAELPVCIHAASSSVVYCTLALVVEANMPAINGDGK
jgi:hypothetical protein